MKEFSVPLALVDFIPVLFFAVSSVILQRDLYSKMSKGAFALFAAGTIDVVCSGALKATYKLLYGAGICDFARLNDMFFPVQSLGFLLAGLGIMALIFHKQGKGTSLNALAAAPPLYSGTMIFIGLMVAGLGMMMAGLATMAKRMGKKGAIALFGVAFICSLCMGYLSTKNFELAIFNWIAEGVNIVGQSAMLLGVISLHKAGLAK